jgi:hypothetical protein
MPEKKKVISQIQSAGEDAIGRLAKTDTARNAIQRATELRDRAGKTLAGLERIEARLDAIEKRLAALEGSPRKTSTRASSTKSSSASKSKTAS